MPAVPVIPQPIPRPLVVSAAPSPAASRKRFFQKHSHAENTEARRKTKNCFFRRSGDVFVPANGFLGVNREVIYCFCSGKAPKSKPTLIREDCLEEPNNQIDLDCLFQAFSRSLREPSNENRLQLFQKMVQNFFDLFQGLPRKDHGTIRIDQPGFFR